MNVLSIRNLSKSFGQQQIIKNLNMSVPEGSVFGFIGQNGAGKTTLIGKLAYRFKQEGKRVLIAAGDTFRAAAEEQVDIWSKRSCSFSGRTHCSSSNTK